MSVDGSGHIENLVIVGSGPAGYTAAIYAARANLQPLLVTGFQRGGIPGGQLMTTTHVENFPGFPDGILGPDLMDLMKSQAVRWGTHLIEADADSINLSQRPFRIEAEGTTILAHAVVIARISASPDFRQKSATEQRHQRLCHLRRGNAAVPQ